MKYIAIILALIGSNLALPLDFEEDSEYPINTFGNCTDEQSDLFDDERVVGGTDTTIERYPWQLSLRQRGRHICGASALTVIRGLTAAHCLSPNLPSSTYSVLAGTNNRLQQDGRGFVTPIQRHILHPQWHRPTIRNDVAVLWFASPLPLGPTIRPIPLPAQDAQVPYRVTAVVAGWGNTRQGVISLPIILQHVTAPIITNEQCNNAYRGRVTADMVCAGYPQGGRGTCQGDSGGALVANGVQVGIVSWARGCAQPNFPTVFARVAVFRNWIRSVM